MMGGERLLWEEARFVGVLRSHFPFERNYLFMGVLRGAFPCSCTVLHSSETERRKAPIKICKFLFRRHPKWRHHSAANSKCVEKGKKYKPPINVCSFPFCHHLKWGHRRVPNSKSRYFLSHFLALGNSPYKDIHSENVHT